MTAQTHSPPALVNTSKINVVQATKGKSQQLRSKEKGKAKSQKENPPQEKEKTWSPNEK